MGGAVPRFAPAYEGAPCLIGKKLVSQVLSGLALDAAEKDEVHAELAAHLEDFYESLRTKGLSEQAAIQQTLAQVANWPDLRRKILIAKKEETS